MMLVWILSSSVLILGIIGIRFLFQKKMKCKLQYALWLLVLIRLLVPFSIGHSSYSVSSTVNTISPIVMEQSQGSEQPRGEMPMENPTVLPAGGADRNPGMEKQPASPMVEAESISFREMLPKILSGIWITGSIVTGLTFLSANVTFRRRLKISRHRIPAYPCKLPVYVTNRIQSPCLFGLHHSAIYLTRQVMENERMIRHTVAHEFTHYRHKDHMWAILRGLCLTIHWFNPLVWWAAILSQRDAELACDEDTIKLLGEGERKAYGMTLIHVSCQKNTNLLTAATTMTADKKVLKQRIQTIARKRKNAALAVITVTLLAAVFVGCTFSGAEKAKNEEKLLPEETTLQTEEAALETLALVDDTIRETASERNNEKVLTYMQSGILQDTPARLYSDPDYSLLLPSAGWKMTDEDGSVVLRSENEIDAWIEIRNLGNISVSKAQTLFHSSEFDLLEDARGGLGGTDHTGEKYQQISFYPADEGTYAVRYVFPMDQWEGIGYEIMAICDSFSVLHPSQMDTVTYFSYVEGKSYPVSWISGGVQQLSGDMGPYSLWQDSLISGAQVPDSLGPVEQNGQNRGELRLYSNGSWDFFPDSVQVMFYEPGDVTWDSPWYTYFYEKLESYGSYSPVIIQEAVTFTWNGRRAELVTASNLIEANLENTEDSGKAYLDTPGNKGPSVYTFVTLFLDGKSACDLYDSCYMIPSEQSGEDSEILYEAKEGYLPYMTVWQYNLEGTLIEVPLYVNDTGLHNLLPQVSQLSSLVADLDGDGDSEILICTEAYSSLYSNYQVYDMNDGEVSVSLSVGLN